jgi:hypothetical protein
MPVIRREPRLSFRQATEGELFRSIGRQGKISFGRRCSDVEPVMSIPTVKEEARRLLDQLPEDAGCVLRLLKNLVFEPLPSAPKFR